MSRTESSAGPSGGQQTLDDRNRTLHVESLTARQCRAIIKTNPKKIRVPGDDGTIIKIRQNQFYRVDDVQPFFGAEKGALGKTLLYQCRTLVNGKKCIWGRHVVAYSCGNLKAVIRLEELQRNEGVDQEAG